MNRLTDKNVKLPNTLTMFDNEKIRKKKILENNIYNKLSKLEDIEQELGIDLITLFKAMKNGFYIIYENETHYIRNAEFVNYENYGYSIFCELTTKGFIFYWLKDYGKTWALTKEELENGK